jgi:hypothetical protein
MQILVSVGAGKTGKVTETFLWPIDVPLVIPREGEYADFRGLEPSRVVKVTYIYERTTGTGADDVTLTIHIRTAKQSPDLENELTELREDPSHLSLSARKERDARS